MIRKELSSEAKEIRRVIKKTIEVLKVSLQDISNGTYKEALERANVAYKDEDRHLKAALERIFPELKEPEDERIRKQIISFLKEFEHDHYRNLDFSSWIAWLEKQGEQKSINDLTQQETMNIADTKFKFGDWIVYNRNDHSRKIMQIYDIRDNRYYFNDDIHFSWSVKECDEKSHLWTIKDAKDGDVLVHSSFMFDDFIFIYNNTSNLQAYCYYSKERNKFIIEDRGHYCPWNMQEVKPATKEQQDFLFQRMKKDGYEFDAYEKVLNKVIIYESKKER